MLFWIFQKMKYELKPCLITTKEYYNFSFQFYCFSKYEQTSTFSFFTIVDKLYETKKLAPMLDMNCLK